MTYRTLLQLTVCSREREDDMPLREARLTKHVELPIPPQPGLRLQDQLETHNAIIKTIAVHGQSLIATLAEIQIGEKRIDEIVSGLKEQGWK